MNLVGKIFVFLVLLASLVFMTMGMMVYATHTNWYNEVMRSDPTRPGFKAQVTKLHDEEKTLKADIEKLKGAIAAEQALKDSAIAKAETYRLELDSREKALKDQVDKDAEQLKVAAKNVETSQAALAAAQKENVDLRESIRLALKQVDEKMKLATKFEDELHIAQGQLTDLQKRAEQLAADYAKATQLLKSVGLNPKSDLTPPRVVGTVLVVDSKNDRAEISLGTDDGVLEGNTLEIVRGDKYVGRMQVVEAHPHRSVGAILPEYKRDVIRNNDTVATKL